MARTTWFARVGGQIVRNFRTSDGRGDTRRRQPKVAPHTSGLGNPIRSRISFTHDMFEDYRSKSRLRISKKTCQHPRGTSVSSPVWRARISSFESDSIQTRVRPSDNAQLIASSTALVSARVSHTSHTTGHDETGK